MISNHATSPSKPKTARMQQQSLLPPREENKVSPRELIQKKKKDRSKSPTTKKATAPETPKDTTAPTSTDAEASNLPGYLRPKHERRRARSKTPPRRPRSPLQMRPRNKSPLRSKNKNKENSKLASPKNDKGEKKRIILSPKTQQKSERQNRPSFQGLSVIEGKRKKEQLNGDNLNKIEQAKSDRRRKSLDFMRKSAQSQQIRDMLESTMGNYELSTFIVEGTAEERLQAVMTKAKESGMDPENIFHFFNGGNPNTIYITKETFLEALEKLGDSFLIVSDDELEKIVKKFDHNNDGKISIDEFKHYCYNIPSIPWKAEKSRLERSGELKKLRAQLSRRFTIEPTKVDDDHTCGNEVHKTSKFFWKTNNNVDIRLFHCESLNVITVQLYCQTLGKELPSIYVCKNKIEFQIKNLEQEIEKAMQTKDNLNDNAEERKTKATWEIISKYISSRLKLKVHSEISEEEEEVPELECAHISNEASCIPFLCKLTGDTYDTLMIQKPLNLKPPPLTEESDETLSDDFDGKMASFRKEARRARASRQSAQGLTDLVSSALSEVETTLGD